MGSRSRQMRCALPLDVLRTSYGVITAVLRLICTYYCTVLYCVVRYPWRESPISDQIIAYKRLRSVEYGVVSFIFSPYHNHAFIRESIVHDNG